MHITMKRFLSILFTVLMLLQSLSLPTAIAEDGGVAVGDNGGGTTKPSDVVDPSSQLGNVGQRGGEVAGRTFFLSWFLGAGASEPGGTIVVSAKNSTTDYGTIELTGPDWEGVFDNIPDDARVDYEIVSGLDTSIFRAYDSKDKTKASANTIAITSVYETPVHKHWINVPKAYRQDVTVIATMVSGEDESPNASGNVLTVAEGDLSAKGDGYGELNAVADAFIMMPAYNSDGQPFKKFKVQEITLGGNLEMIGGAKDYNLGEEIHLYNTMNQTFTFEKVWQGQRDEGIDRIVVQLVRENDGKVMDTKTVTVQVGADGTRTWEPISFNEVPLAGYDEATKTYVEYTYRVEETGIFDDDVNRNENLIDQFVRTTVETPKWGYTSNFKIRNRKQTDEEKMIIRVVKTWDDQRASGSRSATFTITQMNGDTLYQSIRVSGGNAGNNYTVEGEREVDRGPANDPYIYDVQEPDIPGFIITDKRVEKAEDGSLITYYYTNKSLERSVTLTKVWNDDGDISQRPTVRLYLMQDGVRYEDDLGKNLYLEIQPGDPTTLDIHNLERYINAQQGTEHVYTVQEVWVVEGQEIHVENGVLDGYSVSYNGTTVTNTKLEESGTRRIFVHKIWETGTWAYTTLPAIELQLFETIDGVKTPVGASMKMPEGTKLSEVFEWISGQHGFEWKEGAVYTVEEVTDEDSRWSVVIGDIVWNQNIGTIVVTNKLTGNLIEREPTYTSLFIRKTWTVTDPGAYGSIEEYIAALRAAFTIVEKVDGVSTGILSDDVSVIVGTNGYTFGRNGEISILGNGYIQLRVPEYGANGERYTYEVVEADITGFYSAPPTLSTGYYHFRNVQETVDITGTKIWENLDIRDDYLGGGGWDVPDVKLTLYRSVPGVLASEEVETITIPASAFTEYQGDFTKLWGSVEFDNYAKYVYYEGAWHEYVYYIGEYFDTTDRKDFALTGGEVDSETMTGTRWNTYDILNEMTSFFVEKHWVGSSEIGYPKVTIELYADGARIDEIVLPTDTETPWQHRFQGLPKYGENGQRIVYSAKEVAIGGQPLTAENEYKVSIPVEGTEKNIEFQRTREYAMDAERDYHVVNTVVVLEKDLLYDIIGYKLWETRPGEETPDEVTFVLERDGVPYKTVTLRKGVHDVLPDGRWMYTFEQMEYWNAEKNRPYTYLLYEINPPSGYYAMTYLAMDFDRYPTGHERAGELYAHATIVNRPSVTQTIKVVKQWMDNNPELRRNAAGDEEITITFWAGGTPYSLTLTPDGNGNWEGTIELSVSVELTDGSGNPYTHYLEYRITEEDLLNHIWDRNELKDLVAVGNDNTSFTLEGVGTDPTVTLFNKLMSNTSISGSKRWIDDPMPEGMTRPNQIRVQLEQYVADATQAGGLRRIGTMGPYTVATDASGDLRASGTDTWTWSILAPKFTEGDNPQEIIYIWREIAPFPNHYTVRQDESKVVDGVLQPIINELELTSLTGEKDWVNELGGENYDVVQPTTPILIQLYRKTATGEPEKLDDYFFTVVGNDRAWSFPNLPKYAPDGVTPYIYYVVEETVIPGYEKTDGLDDTVHTANEDGTFISDVVNTLLPGSLEITKRWFGITQETSASFVVRAVVGNETIFSFPVELDGSESTPWTLVIEDLPVYDRTGNKITYVIEETAVDPDNYEYVVIVNGSFVYGETPVVEVQLVLDDVVTATFNNAEQINIGFNKTWVDADDINDMRPKRDANNPDDSTIDVALQWSVDGGTTWLPENPVFRTLLAPDEDNAIAWPDPVDAKDAEGTTILYRFVERVPGGYNATTTPNTYANDNNATYVYVGEDGTFTNTLDMIQVDGSKVWTDGDGDFGELVRPTAIVVTLYQSLDEGGTDNEYAIDNPKTIYADQNGDFPSWSWVNLPKNDEDGNPYYYTQVEEVIPGYATDINPDVENSDDNRIVQIIDNQLELINIEVDKAWLQEAEGAERPVTSIDLYAMVDYGLTTEKTIFDPITKDVDTSIDDWSATYTNLPKYYHAEGTDKLITYVLKETPNEGYYLGNEDVGDGQVTGDGWQITVDSVADLEDGDTVEVTFNNIESRDNITVVKEWVDDEEFFQLTRPRTIYFQLLTYINGDLDEDRTVTETMTFNMQTGETIPAFVDFGDLPYEDTQGNVYTYKVIELPLDNTGDNAHYDSKIELTTVINEESGHGQWTATNTYKPLVFGGTKTWVNDQFGAHPTTIDVRLYADLDGDDVYEVEIGPETVPLGLNNTFTWPEDLPYGGYNDEGDYVVYKYLLVETEPVGYDGEGDLEYEGSPAIEHDGNFTNTLKTINIEGEKTWDGEGDFGDKVIPSSIKVTLYQDGDVFDHVDFINPVIVDEDDDWTWSWTGLPEINPETGVAYVYTLVEENLGDGFATVLPAINYDEDAELYRLDATNTMQLIDLKVIKDWQDDPRTEEERAELVKNDITITLNAYKQGGTVPLFTTSVTVPAAEAALDDWSSAVFNGLPMYYYERTGTNDIQAFVIEYRVSESAVPGYRLVNDTNGQVTVEMPDTLPETPVSVTLENEPFDGEITVTKTIVDEEAFGTSVWPRTLTFNLYQYTQSGSGWINKTPWGSREVTLQADGTYTVATFSDLPADNGAGALYRYEVEEETLPADWHYGAPTITPPSAANGNTQLFGEHKASNPYIPLEIGGNKAWAGDEKFIAARPTTIEVTLYADKDGDGAYETPVDTLDITPAADGTFTWPEKLPHGEFNAAGTYIPYSYLLVETEPVGYDGVGTSGTHTDGNPAIVSGGTFTNTLKTVDVGGAKDWTTTSEYGALVHPSSIKVTLYQGENVFTHDDFVNPFIANAGNNWSWLWEGLPEIDPATGNAYVYTLVEEDLGDGYVETPSFSYDGEEKLWTLDETNDQQLIDIRVNKDWDDEHDTADERADVMTQDIVITLAAYDQDGDLLFEVTPSKTVLNAEAVTENWDVLFEGLPMYYYVADGDGNNVPYLIVYKVGESVIDSYQLTNANVDKNGLVIVSMPDELPEDEIEVTLVNKAFDGSLTVYKTTEHDNAFWTEVRPAQLTYYVDQYIEDGDGWKLNDDEFRTGTADLITTGDDAGKYTPVPFDNLPQQENITGLLYRYEVREAPLTNPDYDEPEYTLPSDAGNPHLYGTHIVNNPYAPITIGGEKEWLGDEDNLYKTRPINEAENVYINVTLYVDKGGVVSTTGPVQIVPEDDGTFAWPSPLPKGGYVNGVYTVYHYWMVEEEPAGYIGSGSYAYGDLVAIEDGGLFENTLDTIDVTGKKDWTNEGLYGQYVRPSSLEITLLRNTVALDIEGVENPKVVPVADDEDGTATWSWTGLPKFDKSGNEYTYEIIETPLGDAYIPEAVTPYNDATIANLLHLDENNDLQLIDIKVIKDWKDKWTTEAERALIMEQDITVTLYAHDQDGNTLFTIPAVTVPNAVAVGTDWGTLFTGLPMYYYDADNNPLEIVYKLGESGIVGYSLTNGTNGLVDVVLPAKPGTDDLGVGTLVNAANDGSITVTKTTPGDQPFGNEVRPATLTYYLDQYIQDGNGSWTMYAQAYKTDTATLIPETGTYTDVVFPNLPADNGEDLLFQYKVREAAISSPDYGTPTITPPNETEENPHLYGTHAVLNPYTPIKIGGTKAWVDQDNAFRTRLINETGNTLLDITLWVSKDGGATFDDVETKTIALVGTGDTQTFVWPDDLPAGGFVNGTYVPYQYVLVEEVPTGYTGVGTSDGAYNVPEGSIAIINGGTYTNTLETINIEGEKDWLIGELDDFVLPHSIEITLMLGNAPAPVNGQANPVTVTPEADGSMSWSWTNLPKYDPNTGAENAYWIDETDFSDGFVFTPKLAVVDGNLIILDGENEIQLMSIEVIKDWRDEWTDETRGQVVKQDIDITLYALDQDGNELFTRSETVPEGTAITETWNLIFPDLPVYYYDAQGARQKVVYEIEESSILGYRLLNVVNNEGRVVVDAAQVEVSNTAEVELVNQSFDGSITIDKTWPDDALYAEDTRPATLTFYLEQYITENGQRTLNNGRYAEITVAVNADGSLAEPVVFKNLPVEDTSNPANPYDYEVKEDPIVNYQDVVIIAHPGNDENGFGEYMAYNPLRTIDLTGRKTWDDLDDLNELRPTEIMIGLEQAVVVNGTAPETWTWNHFADAIPVSLSDVQLDATGNTWTYSWPNAVPELDTNGNAYAYRFVETFVADPYYAVREIAMADTEGETGEQLNTLDLIDLEGVKTWLYPEDSAMTEDELEAVLPREITVTLLRSTDGTRANAAEVVQDGILQRIVTNEAGGWDWLFTNMPMKDKLGNTYTYFIREEGAEGSGYSVTYPADEAGNEMDADNEMLWTDLIVYKKSWGDENNEGSRPVGGVGITLYGYVEGEQSPVITVTGKRLMPENWEETYTGMPLYYQGKLVTYEVVEDVPAGYVDYASVKVPGTENEYRTYPNVDREDRDGTLALGINNLQLVTGHEFTKAWIEPDTLARVINRPTEILFDLYRSLVEEGDPNGEMYNDPAQPYKLIVDQNADTQTIVISDLPAVEGDVEWKYWLVERAVTGYETTETPIDHLTENALELVSVTIRKDWEGEFEVDDVINSAIPEEINAVLRGYAHGSMIIERQVTLRAGDTPAWEATEGSLPRYAYDADGNVELVTYTVEEIDGYEVFGVAVVYSIDGVTVTELAAEEGEYAAVITNTLKTIEVEITKVFALDDEAIANGDTPRLDTLKIFLYRRIGGQNGEFDTDFVRSKTITDIVNDAAQDTYTVTFGGLATHDLEDREYYYFAQEEALTNYGVKASEDERTLTNELELVSVSGTKFWQNDYRNEDGTYTIRPQTITLQLIRWEEGQTAADADPDFSIIQVLTVDDTLEQDWRFDNLAKYVPGKGDTKVAYVYDVVELDVPGYVTSYNRTKDGDDFIINITNALDEIEIQIVKSWVGDQNDKDYRPTTDGLTVTLEGTDGNGNVVYRETAKALPRTSGANNWTASFKGVPRTDNAGNLIAYAIDETVPAGYTLTDKENPVVEEEGNLFQGFLTNTFETVDKAGRKTWNDSENRLRTRPTSIQVTLHRSWVYPGGGAVVEPVQTKTVTADDLWAWNFTGLPKYHESGAEYVYFISENNVDSRYTSTVTGDERMDLRNDLITVDVEITKKWEDNNNAFGVRPTTLNVYLASSTGARYTGTVSAINNWTFTFDGLPKYDASGNLVTYTLSEADMENYQLKGTIMHPVASVAASKYTGELTNELITTEIAVQKVWSGGTTRPNVTILLMNGSRQVTSVTLSTTYGWLHTFTGLPRYDTNGTEIVYTVREISVDGYTTTGPVRSTVNGVVTFTITNTYVVEASPSPSVTPSVTPSTTPPRYTPQTNPSSSPTASPSASPSPTPGTNRQITIVDLDVPLGAGINLNLGDCFD